VQFRSGKDPVLYLTIPTGVERAPSRRMLDADRLSSLQHANAAIREIDARIAQYEMAYRMQTSASPA
jgi:hypothetical protein